MIEIRQLSKHGPALRRLAASFLTPRGVAWVWPLTVILALIAARQHRRLGRELEALTGLQQAVQHDNDSAKESSIWHLRTAGGRRSRSRRPTGGRHGGGRNANGGRG